MTQRNVRKYSRLVTGGRAVLHPANSAGYVIRVSETALIHMCMAGLEAYSVSHLRKGPRVRLETYGLLWGHETQLPDRRTLYSVELATVDTSARMEHDAVVPTDEALQLKRDLMTSFWPQLEFLGDFHTHPWEKARAVLASRRYQFSDADRKSIECDPTYWHTHGYRVGLVLTIACMERASSREHRWLEDGTLEFTLGNYRLWLKGYVALDDDGELRLTADCDPSVLLDCPALIGLVGEYSKFGRAKRGSGRRHHTGAVDLGGLG